MSSVTIRTLQDNKQQDKPFAVLTAYDATFAQLAANAGVEVILVGDSLGMVLQGQTSTLPVSVEDMCYHTRCVAQGNLKSQSPALIMSDLPFMSYSTVEQGLLSARTLMQAGAHMVKLEGDDYLCPLVRQLSQQGVPVCAHLGLTPQAVNKLGGYRVQGRDQTEADLMIEHAQALVAAGADCVLLECVPIDVAQRLTQTVNVPVIGIGAGAATDAQVLVMHDMLGLNETHTPKFVKNFMTQGRTVQQAFAAYVDEVQQRKFPTPEHSFK